jgi:hypothetical protein
MEHSSESIQWNVQFSRLIQDWEVGDLAAFYKCLYEYKIRGEGETSYGGCLLVRGSLRLSLSIELFRLMGRSLSHGRVFGSPKLLLEWLSLFGRRCIARSLL